MKTLAKLWPLILAPVLLLVAAATFMSPPKALAAPLGFTNAQIQAASGFSFSNGGATVTGKIGGKTVQFTGGGQLLQYPPQTLSSLVKCTGTGCNLFEWKVSPSDVFCKPTNWKPVSNVDQYYLPNHPGTLLINAHDIRLNSANKITSATAHLIAFAGPTDAACQQTIAGNSQTGVTLTVSASTGAPTGAAITQSSLNTAVYKFGSNGSTINATYQMANGSPVSMEFVDQQPYDDIPNFVATNASAFCASSGLGTPSIDFASGDQSKQTISLTKIALPIVSDASGTCKPGSLPALSAKGRAVNNSGLIAKKVFQWDGTGLQSFGSKGVLDLVLDNQTGQNDNRLYADDVNSSCGGWVVLLDSPKANSGKIYHLTPAGSGSVVNGYYNRCGVDKGTPRNISVAGVWDQAPQDGAGGGGAVSDDPETTCQQSYLGASGHQLSWLFCPIMAAAQTATEGLTNLIENLLSFSVKNSLKNDNRAGEAWANIRNISSVLLVVIMLIMVLSQAVSWGPFDAYTVRKVLPKLVVAVIAMQLSWSLLTYIFDLFNNIGRGVADLLYAPFGGSSEITIFKALEAAGIGTGATAAINWVALGGTVIVGILSFPTLVIAAWAVVVALLTGFIVLVFRQILLIACLIFAPLAILAWILPNTNRYWKLWYDNFTKLLLMFPMIMGILAVGKIFAIIAGTTTTSGPAGSVLRFIFIVVGFYGPYFLLPKTYKWGGAAMSLASQGISKATASGSGPVSNYLKGRQERSRWNLSRQQRKAELMRRAQAGWAEGMSSSRFGGLQGRVNRARTAGLSSLVRSRVDRETRGRIAQSALAQREKVLKEQADETLAPLVETGNWAGIESLAHTGNSHEREAAIAQIITSRRWEEAARLRADPTTEADWSRTLAKNGDLVGTLDEKRADLLAGPSRPIMRVIAGGDVAIDRATGQPRLDPVTHQPIINSGLTPAQLVQQHATFWTAAGSSIGAASDDEVRGTYERMELMARDPRALQLIGGGGESGANLVLNEYRQRFGAGAGSLRDLVEQQRMPPPTSSAPPAPPAGGGGTFTPRSGSTSTPI